MRVEFFFRTYSSFGSNVTLHLAGQWLNDRLKQDYGGGVTSMLIELCCRNASPPRKTLEKMNDSFEKFLTELPTYSYGEDRSAIRICYRAVKYYHDEVSRDSQVLALKQFSSVLRKAGTLAKDINVNMTGLKGFDDAALAQDIEEAARIAPKTLNEMARMFLDLSE